jgi:hypothetical protein
MATTITINNVRFSYCNLFQPSSRPGQDPKFSTTVLVPKTNTAAKAAIDAAIEAATQEGVSKKWNGQRPPIVAISVHDGDGVRPSDGMPYGAECKGCWVFTASSTKKPFVVDADMNYIIDPTQVYSGMWGNVNLSFFPYASTGKKGVGIGLNGVQKVHDGDPLTSQVTAEEAFKPVPMDQRQPAPAAQGYAAQAPAPGYAPPAQQYTAPAPAAQGYAAPQVDPITGQPIQQQ